MMATLKSTKLLNNDLDITSGTTTVIYDNEALAQRLKNRLKLWLGEWYLLPKEGVDYLGLFNNNLYFQRRFESMMRKALLSDEYVLAVTQISIEYDNVTGELAASYAVKSTFGSITGSI
jgi:hypothetical protein